MIMMTNQTFPSFYLLYIFIYTMYQFPQGLGKTIQTIAFLAWLKYRIPADKRRTAIDVETVTLDTDSDGQANIDSTSPKSDSDVICHEGSSDDVEMWIEDGQDGKASRFSQQRTKMLTTHPRKPHIVIVPASVLSNWEREIDKVCPSLVVIR